MWIDRDNFSILEHMGGKGQMTFDENRYVPENLKVAFDDLTKEQKKMLPEIHCDFKVYCHGSTAGTSKIKDRVIKEPLFKKEDVIDLVKFIIKSKDREEVFDRIVNSSISPVLIQIWMLRPCMNGEAWDTYVKAETYIYNTVAYASVMCDPSIKAAKFCFPKAVRPKEE